MYENLLLYFKCHKHRSSLSDPEQLKLSIFLCNFYTFREIRITSLPENSFGIVLLETDKDEEMGVHLLFFQSYLIFHESTIET